MNPPPPHTDAYHDTRADAAVAHGKEHIDKSACLLLTPQLHNGKLYHRRAIVGRTTIYFEPSPLREHNTNRKEPMKIK